MAYWLVKSEPGSWSWDDQVKAGTTDWSGVRNPQATNFMKAMKRGDRAFFYHSGEERRIVGVIEVVKEFYPDVEVRGDLGEHDTLLSIDKARRLLGYEPAYGWRADRKQSSA